MEPMELERYLHDTIPLSRAMAVTVVHAGTDAVVLRAPLGPNTNPHHTVFAGSASTLAILAAWSLLHARLAGAGIRSRLVLQRNTMEYQLPITGDFTATAAIEEEDGWHQFTRMLARKGKGRITVASVLHVDEQAVGRLTGEFVALQESETE